MTICPPTHRARVEAALRHEPTDRPPRDLLAEPLVWQKLMRHFRTDDPEAVMRAFDIDCRVISYDWEAFYQPSEASSPNAGPGCRTWKREVRPRLYQDVWGAHREVVCNATGAYEDLCDYPLASAESIEELQAYAWPTPHAWDFSALPRILEHVNPGREFHLRYRIGSIFETAWSLRGFDRFLMDLVVEPELAGYIMDRILEVHLENLRRVMELGGAAIDMLYFYDDLATQQSLLLAPGLWRKVIRPRQQRLFTAARKYGKPLMMHSCGAVRPLLPDLIDLGLDVLNPLQPRASGMDFAALKKEFGARLTFHGGIDIQELLPHGSPEEVRAEVQRVVSILGANGGYILAPAHHIQSDTPLENVLAIYSSCSGPSN